MKIGFIGLGNLGKAMAKRLTSEGSDITVWNRTIEKAKDLGCKIASSPAELISKVDVVFLNLLDSNAVMDVISGKNGLVYGECTGKIVVDTTTNHFERVLEFYNIMENKNAYYLECPVLGSVIPALQGLLTIVVSGKKEVFETVKPQLEKIGKNIFYLGTQGLSTKMKLVNNLVLGSFMATLAEAIALAESSGIDKDNVIEILLAGAGNSMILNTKKQKLTTKDFSAHFSTELIHKDLHYLQDLSRSLKKPLFTGSIIKELYALAISKNYGHEDFSSIYKIFKDL